MSYSHNLGTMAKSLALLTVATASLCQGFAPISPTTRQTALFSYLDSLNGAAAAQPSYQTSSAPPAATTETSGSTGFCHAPLDYFAFDKLAGKGPRATFDWGTPEDFSRKLADDGVFRAGSWYCTTGGWPSPNGKGATEIFYVISGHGMLGDEDGVQHYFGPGDTVIIPKGHTGRWDVNTDIHKLWSVNSHSEIEESGPIVRTVVSNYMDSAPENMVDTSSCDPLYGSTGCVTSASSTFYDVGPTQVGYWTADRGSFEVECGARQWFVVMEGVMFVTDSDGTSKRCAPGDTVMLPAGWSGYVDVVEPVRKVFTVAR